MYFNKEEKVFSLSRTVGAVPVQDVSQMWSEFFCYLVVAGLYLEGNDAPIAIQQSRLSTSIDVFGNVYSRNLGLLINRGLRERYLALMDHYDVSDGEKMFLKDLDGIFDRESISHLTISAKDFLGIAYRRGFSPVMQSVARYAAVMYGQKDFLGETEVPILYLSLFGNIHLCVEETVVMRDPTLKFRSKMMHEDRQVDVSPLWAMISSITDALSSLEAPGDRLGNYLSKLTFLSELVNSGDALPAPKKASGLLLLQNMGVKSTRPVRNIEVRSYAEFAFGATGTSRSPSTNMIRLALYNYIMKTIGEKTNTSVYNLFYPDSCFLGLRDTRRTEFIDAPIVLGAAFEALEGQPPAPSPDGTDTTGSEDDGATSPAGNGTTTSESEDGEGENEPVNTGEQDPDAENNPDNTVTQENTPPVVTVEPDENNIDLVSFDRTGEGINEELYRREVIALNDRLQREDSIPVSADVKVDLAYWVNGWLYRVAISETEKKISSLGLQKYLKKA